MMLGFGEDKGERKKKNKSLGCILSRKAKQQGHEKNSQQYMLV
jgi:hypothetical protein